MYSPQMVNCYVEKKLFSSIARYQKLNSIGSTNTYQRWKDAEICGARYGDNELWSIIRPIDFRERFHSCMRNRGYHIFAPDECGLKEPKSLNKGICNE